MYTILRVVELSRKGFCSAACFQSLYELCIQEKKIFLTQEVYWCMKKSTCIFMYINICLVSDEYVKHSRFLKNISWMNMVLS